jgi:hypothetical protein
MFVETAFLVLDHLLFDCPYQKQKDVLWTIKATYFIQLLEIKTEVANGIM